MGDVGLVICLDSGAGNYDQLWLTTSLRGMASGTLKVQILTEGIHSGDASGLVSVWDANQGSLMQLFRCAPRTQGGKPLTLQVPPPDPARQLSGCARLSRRLLPPRHVS